MYYMAGFLRPGSAMRYSVTIRSVLPQAAIEGRLTSLAAAGPFRVSGLSQRGDGAWTFAVQPARPGLSVGFGKVAELLVLLAREFDVEAVEREALRDPRCALLA